LAEASTFEFGDLPEREHCNFGMDLFSRRDASPASRRYVVLLFLSPTRTFSEYLCWFAVQRTERRSSLTKCGT